MNFKKPKNQVALDASWAAYNQINYQLIQINNGNIGNVGFVISEAIRVGIEEAIKSMLDDIYTDAEFEEDLGLAEK